MLAWLAVPAVIGAVLAWVPSRVGAGDDENCPAPKEWFPKTPKPTNEKPNPDEDCDFYKWAWQMFLYVTQPDPGRGDRPRFLAYQTPADLFPPSSTPRFARSKKGMLRLAPRLAKQHEHASLDEFLQADSKGALIDRNGRIVYYAIHLNEEFVKFVDANHFRKVDNIFKARGDLEFPRGSVELKSAWKILGTGDDEKKFFTTRAEVAVLALKDGKPTIDPNKTREETVALVGLHVAGVVDGHPEFVWSTFEQDANAPDLDIKGGADPNGTQPVDKTNDFTFYSKGTPAADCNKKSALKFKSQTDQTFEPSTPVYRRFPFGIDDKLVPIEKLDPAIESLNKNVKDSIDKLAPGLSLWKNYSLKGAVWLNNPAYFREGEKNDFAQEDLDHTDRKIIGGERGLSNATIETFTQGAIAAGKPTGKINCFTCHRTIGEFQGGKMVFPPKRIGVSHVLTNAYLFAQEARQAGKGAVEQVLRKREADWAAAVETNDPKQIGLFFTDDFLFVGAGGILQDRTQHLEDFRSEKLVVKSVKLGDTTVHVYGSAAVVSSRVTVEGTFDKRDISGAYQFTDTWVKQGEQWLAAARQQTRVAKP
jgi:ketosteroid isomerase-like protein